MEYNEALTVLRDFAANTDFDRIREAVKTVIEHGFDPPLLTVDEMFGMFPDLDIDHD